MLKREPLRFVVTLVGSLLLASAAIVPSKALDANKTTEPHNAGSDVPDTTTETYADWVLICSKPSGSRICEVDTTLSTGGQNAAFARVAFGRPAKDKPFHLVVVIPVNIQIAPGLRFDAEPGNGVVTIGVRSCSAGGCFAEGDVSADQLQVFRKRTGPGQMSLTDAAGRQSTFQMSFRGLDQAMDALSKK